jgi:hypothetical protein
MTTRRLFIIWNRGYKTQHVVAADIDEALRISRDSGHTRKGHRRWKDITDDTAEGEEKLMGVDHRIVNAVNFGKSGVATLDVNNGWLINGEPTWDEMDTEIDAIVTEELEKAEGPVDKIAAIALGKKLAQEKLANKSED